MILLKPYIHIIIIFLLLFIKWSCLTAELVVKTYITHDAVQKIPPEIPSMQIMAKELAGNVHF